IIASLRARRRNIALAGGCCVLDLLAFSRMGVEFTGLTIGAYAFIGYTFLIWRDRTPVIVFTAMWIHQTVAAVVIPDYRPVFGIVVALYTVTVLKRRRIGLAALALTFVPTGLGSAAEFNTASPDRAFRAFLVAATMLSLFNIGAWLFGRWVHANHQKLLLMEQRRAAAAREAVAAERSRLARELHDIIAHCVSVMLLQAAGARRMLASDPERAAKALANIEHSGKQATGELRRLLGVLRTGDLMQPEGEPDDQPGLADLEPLLDRVRAGGVMVRLRTHGQPERLDPSVDMSAYRILQEALTNVTKYVGRGADTTVELCWEDGMLHLTVTDDGCGQLDHRSAHLANGYGLLGLRERVAAVGGQLHAGPLPDGGFQVTATMPARRKREVDQTGQAGPTRADSGAYRGTTDATSGDQGRYSW
ncbi:MAG: sensor histidine kinase, partial [Pseudonocardiaceae bacterium]